MEDEIDIARGAVGQVMWKYFHIFNSSAAGPCTEADQPGKVRCAVRRMLKGPCDGTRPH